MDTQSNKALTIEKYKNVQDVFAFFENSRFVVLNEDKTPKASIKNPINRLPFSECQSEANLGLILENNYCVVDIDNKDHPEAYKKMLQLVDSYGWETSIMETTRGFHFWFKCPPNGIKNYTDVVLPCGIRADIKSANATSYVVIKKNNKIRNWLRFNNKVDILPMELTPIEGDPLKDLPTPINLAQGSRRNNLFERIKVLVRAGFTKKQIYNLFTIINNILFATPMDANSLNSLFSGFDEYFESFRERNYFSDKGRVLNNAFCDFFIKKYLLVKYSEQLYYYDFNNNTYVRGDNEIKGLIIKEEQTLEIPQVNQILETLKVSLLVPKRQPEENIIALQNGLYDVQNFKFLEFSPNYFVINKINVFYDPLFCKFDAIKKFFKDITANDENLQKILFEFVGYCLTQDTRYQKALLLYGPSARNGKSTFIDLLRYFFGVDNCVNLSLEDFDKRFSTSLLLDKLVNLGADISTEHIKDPSMLKKLVTGDTVMAEFKGKNSFTFKNKAKLIFATNKLPTTQEKSDGYFRRFIIVPFVVRFEGDKDNKNILDDLKTPDNMNALFHLALEGLKRLKHNNTFSNSESVKNLLQNYKEQNSNVISFFQNGPINGFITTEDGRFLSGRAIKSVYSDYKIFCEDFQYKPLNLQNFKAEVLAFFKDIEIRRVINNSSAYEVFEVA
ncbi:phage/plasmid primase, P4 family [[Mycoplasma] gypis]|uniref:Phage/plasmid primase, P4 family n=1 Tax=[Mycoplasma] gypis TaxID=92404 RepID=A0ABZ2RQE8_9BACT|nr:phage/plasmid primase, P4 family [[Mycoplasma] gypis]MBN0919445.1 bifunctional DNA primase/polymerase [[Mycoplasma] gypis]